MRQTERRNFAIAALAFAFALVGARLAREPYASIKPTRRVTVFSRASLAPTGEGFHRE